MICARCGREVAPMPRPPQPGKLGTEIQERVCGDCWADWQGMEVMVINELRLNFMDPAAQQVLRLQMRRFLQIEDEPPGGMPPAEAPPG